jgi:hypothetical protein
VNPTVFQDDWISTCSAKSRNQKRTEKRILTAD